MTRLSSSDISGINSGLQSYDKHLLDCTGRSMLDIACVCCGVDSDCVCELASGYKIGVVPVTAGLGIISNFSEVVAAILAYLGFSAEVSETTDVTGFANTVEAGVNGVFMADDNRFIGYDIKSGSLADNSEATGRIYATALHLMNRQNNDRQALVIGCGPVGFNAATRLLQLGWSVVLYDTDRGKAESACQLLQSLHGGTDSAGRARVSVAKEARPEDYLFIVDATPESQLICENQLSERSCLAIPGVPPGITAESFRFLDKRVIHDKLELGVASMAVSLLKYRIP